jgi:hypothetical protein
MHGGAGDTEVTYFLATDTEGIKTLLFTSPLLGTLTTGDKVKVIYSPSDSTKGEPVASLVALVAAPPLQPCSGSPNTTQHNTM